MRILKTLLFNLLLLSVCCFESVAQERDTLSMEQDSLYIAPLDTVRSHKVVYPEHLIGLRYSYCITGVGTNIDMNQKGYNSPVNIELLYTYYHPLWGYIGCFGLQTGIRYTKFGFTSENNIPNFFENVTTLQLPVLSAFHFDIGKRLRIFANIGPYIGYRLSTTKEKGWDCFDKRFEYGIEGLGGIGLRFGRFEIHLGAGYQYCFGFLFDPEKFSSASWIYTHPHSLNLSCGWHYKLK